MCSCDRNTGQTRRAEWEGSVQMPALSQLLQSSTECTHRTNGQLWPMLSTIPTTFSKLPNYLGCFLKSNRPAQVAHSKGPSEKGAMLSNTSVSSPKPQQIPGAKNQQVQGIWILFNLVVSPEKSGPKLKTRKSKSVQKQSYGAVLRTVPLKSVPTVILRGGGAQFIQLPQGHLSEMRSQSWPNIMNR